MEQYINKDALVAKIEKRTKINKECMLDLKNFDYYQGKVDALNDTLSFLNTLEAKEIPETTHTECKKIKKLCEIQRYNKNGEAYSVMLPDTRLFMNKINEIIDVIADINSRLLIVEQKKGE